MAYKKEESEYKEGTVWNFDDEQAKLMFTLKLQFVTSLCKWDLEEAYWVIRTILMEEKALLSEKEQNDMKDQLDDLSTYRLEYIQKPISEQKINKSEYFVRLETIYTNACELMKQHGLYFRERQDDEGL